MQIPVWARLVATLSLSLSTGACILTFTLVDAVLMRPLPYRKSDELVRLYEVNRRYDSLRAPVAPANYLDWNANLTSFEGLAAVSQNGMRSVLEYGTVGVRASGVAVSSTFFSVFGVPAQLGRVFAPEEYLPSNHSCVCIISKVIWRSLLGSDTDFSETYIKLNGTPCRIIGVLPPFFQIPEGADIWLPLGFTPADSRERTERSLQVYARLKPSVTVHTAQQELQRQSLHNQELYPSTQSGWDAEMLTLHETVTGDFAKPLLLIFLIAHAVLAIAVLNVTSLVVGQLVMQRKAYGLRFALGARTRHIAMLMLRQITGLTVAGAVAGSALAYAAIQALLMLKSAIVPRLHEVGVDIFVICYAIAASFLPGLLISFIAARYLSGCGVSPLLRSGNLPSLMLPKPVSRLRIMVILQVALTLAVVSAAVSLGYIVVKLVDLDRGFVTDNVLAVPLDLPIPSDHDPRHLIPPVVAMEQRIQGSRYVLAAAGIEYPPLGKTALTAMCSPLTGSVAVEPYTTVYEHIVTPALFRTLEIGLLQGRLFDERDVKGAKNVVIVSRAVARLLWPLENPLGRQLALKQHPVKVREVVGIVQDVQFSSVPTGRELHIYIPYHQYPIPFVTFLIRLRSSEKQFEVGSYVRDVISSTDKGIRVGEVGYIKDIMLESFSQGRVMAAAISFFAVISLVVSLAGIYSSTSLVVSHEQREIAIRVACGATPAMLGVMILKRGLMTTGTGLAFGSVIFFVAFKLLIENLYGVAINYSLTLVCGFGILFLATVLALIPSAVQATMIDPVAFLKDDL